MKLVDAYIVKVTDLDENTVATELAMTEVDARCKVSDLVEAFDHGVFSLNRHRAAKDTIVLRDADTNEKIYEIFYEKCHVLIDMEES